VKLTLYSKSLILFAVLVISQFAFLGLVFRIEEEHADAEKWFAHTKEVIAEADALKSDILTAGSGMRGYAITLDPAFSGPYDRSNAEIPGRLDRLESLVADNPPQAKRMETIQTESVQLLNWQANLMKELRAGGIAAAVARIRIGEGLGRNERLRTLIEQFVLEEERLDRERAGELERLRGNMNLVLFTACAASMILALVLGYVFRRGISGRFQILMDNTRRLAAGQPLAATVSGYDEIAWLDRAFREMADTISRTSSEYREAARQFQDLYDQAPCGYHSVDTSGTLINMNQTELRWLGYSEKELIGRVKFVDRVAESSRGEYLATFQRVKERGGAADIELELLRRDGTTFFVLLNSTSVLDANGKYLRSRSTLTDITDRKRAENEVRRLNADLERRVRERTAELAEANHDLSQKNDENEMFVYSVSHDLRSPLVNLQGFSTELGKGCETLSELLSRPGVPEEVREPGAALLGGRIEKSLGFIRAAVSRLSTIIDALLRLSRAGRVEYRWQNVNVGEVVRRVLDAMQSVIAAKHVEVAVGDLPPAWSDSTALEQLFANLINNAVLYLDPARPGRIEIGFDANGPAGEGPVYFVRDNGLGIAEDHRAKVFQVFQRVHPGVGKGEGIGLAIVSRVAERHRGRAWVESRVGQGSTFYIALRATPASNGAAKEESCRLSRSK